MIEKEHYLKVAEKYGDCASWAIWADEGDKPKSNIGDIRIFDLDYNPDILSQLNPNIVMVGLNFSRTIEKERFVNFHDKRHIAQDYKIRYAFKNTKYYGAYMTDVIKDFEQVISGKVISYLQHNQCFEEQNIAVFKQELIDLKTNNPLIIAFGNHTYNILNKHLKHTHIIVKIPHYSKYISKEDYKIEVEKLMTSIE